MQVRGGGEGGGTISLTKVLQEQKHTLIKEGYSHMPATGNLILLNGTYSIRRSSGLGFDSSPICDNPSDGHEKDRKKSPDGNPRVIPGEGVGQGRGQALFPL